MPTMMAKMCDAGEYRRDFCSNNIHALLKQLNEQGVDLTRANVLYILPVIRDTEIFSRFRRVRDSWSFHVVLEADGNVYDFDLVKPINAIPLKEFFPRMFRNSIQMLSVRAIPAGNYLMEFTGTNWGEFTSRISPYPWVPAAQYVE